MKKKLPQYINFLKNNRTIDQSIKIYNQRLEDARKVYDKYSNTFVERSCPVCGSNEKKEMPSFKDMYGVCECKVCLTQYVSPCPSFESLEYYYNECSCNILLGELTRSRHKKNNIIFSERTKFLTSLISSHFKDKQSLRILEVGCSSGSHLSELKALLSKEMSHMQIHYVGIDIDENAIKENVDRDLNLFATSVERFAHSDIEKFDLIIHFELIEHLIDPFTFMKKIKSLLKDGGLHHFQTPNANGFDNKALGYNEFRPLAHGIFPPMHLQSFTPINIMHFSLRSGFKLVQVDTPGNFDVDIVKVFGSNVSHPFIGLDLVPKKYLAIFQNWIGHLNASSHMRITLSS